MASWALGDMCAECNFNAPLPGGLICGSCLQSHLLEADLTSQVAKKRTEQHEADVIEQDERTAA